MLRIDHFQIVVSLLYAHYPIFSYYHTNSIAILYLVHKYKKKFESTNMDLTHSKIMICSIFSSKGVWLFNKIIIWKAQGVPQLNNVAHPKHPEEEEISPNRNHIITGKQQQTN